ncbi:molybdate transport system regulatory protein [Dyadobacter koreensis]|uniref:Molybdate transport system regulatory protein n=1 Tax=Dyadobacter koreensis TaxID=408657 RepID=A0A1H6QZ21_9BACT|nr:winged helix-turn-helix domain-containing protein [Dyadobacter koreensis]SEI44202.1 molybdate transport system regulatory protein [Dyadobacter koreensis]
MERNITIRFRHWVFIDDMKFFGPGRLELLEHIESTGSISKAAKLMNMSYKKAWLMVDEMNNYAKSPYIITQKGGQHGGGTLVTAAGKKLIEAYKKLDAKLAAVVEAEKELLALI